MIDRLEIGPDVAAVLRPEETARLRGMLDAEPLACVACGDPIDAASGAGASLSLVFERETTIARFAHAGCAPSRADLARLVTAADADPLGIAYAQALHPDAGAVLLWERRLDVRVRSRGAHDSSPYLDARRSDGFHGALADEPVRELPGLRLERDGPDLVLLGDDEPRERFHDAAGAAPAGWLDAAAASGFALLIVGAQLGLAHAPRAERIQRALRGQRALLGLAGFDDA